MSRIPPIYGEDYESQWGKIDYTGKIVLDIGGSTGDTADFFLRKGALLVISVDNNAEYSNICRENSKKFGLPILSLNLDMGCEKRWDKLISMFRPDVVKSDCEGCEHNLAKISNESFRIPKEYIIEVHSKNIEDDLTKRFEAHEYKVMDVNAWADPVKIIYWKRD